jgi:2'-5' RNA ligase
MTTSGSSRPSAEVTNSVLVTPPQRMIGVALPIPEPYGTQLQRQRASFGDPLANAIPTHITLLPPTAVDEGDLPKIEEHLLEVAGRHVPFQLHLRGTATFRPVSPVVFIAVVEGISSCEMLSTAVRSGPLPSELPYPYHPHVTVAHHLNDEALDLAFTSLADFEAAFDVTRFALYEHGPDGLWRPQRDFILGGEAAHDHDD